MGCDASSCLLGSCLLMPRPPGKCLGPSPALSEGPPLVSAQWPEVPDTSASLTLQGEPLLEFSLGPLNAVALPGWSDTAGPLGSLPSTASTHPLTSQV